jgi:hypothetical protein
MFLINWKLQALPMLCKDKSSTTLALLLMEKGFSFALLQFEEKCHMISDILS